jgi:hypothetical protein
MSTDLILMLHPSLGVLAILATVWLCAEALNASAANQSRIRLASVAVAALMWGAYLVGGYWYVNLYGADKALIKAGPWPFAHDFFMETKEHVFFALLLLATFLPIAARANLATHRGARQLVIGSGALVVAFGLAMEGAGAFISMGAKLGLLAKHLT